MLVLFAFAHALIQEGSIKIVPKPQLNSQQSVKFTVKAEVGNREAELSATAILKVLKSDPSGAEYSIDWRDIDFSGGEQSTELPFSPYKVDVGADGNLASVAGGTILSDPVRTVLITFFPKPPTALDLNKPLAFDLPAHDAGGIPGMKATETYQGVETVGASSAYKVLVKIEEAKSAKGENFGLDATFWVNMAGDVLKEDGKFINLPISGAGTNAAGTITANVAS